MDMTTQDCLKKALLDTQERVRDFNNYSAKTGDDTLKQFFKDCAKTEGLQAQQLEKFVKEMCD